MFPQLRERFGPALDLIVEFSTLGEYRLGADGVLCPASALAHAAVHKQPARPDAQRSAPEREPQLGGAGAPNAERAAVRRIVAGGAVGRVPAATPAAGRLPGAPLAASCQGERRHCGTERPSRPARPRKAIAPEQLCLAV